MERYLESPNIQTLSSMPLNNTWIKEDISGDIKKLLWTEWKGKYIKICEIQQKQCLEENL